MKRWATAGRANEQNHKVIDTAQADQIGQSHQKNAIRQPEH